MHVCRGVIACSISAPSGPLKYHSCAIHVVWTLLSIAMQTNFSQTSNFMGSYIAIDTSYIAKFSAIIVFIIDLHAGTYWYMSMQPQYFDALLRLEHLAS